MAHSSIDPEGGRMIVRHRHESAYLAANLLGDPGERDLFVYLPPGYEDQDRRYATAYLLHAFGQTNDDMVNPPTTGERASVPVEDVLEPVFRRMGARPMIVVIPNGDMKYGCGQWVDSPVSGSFGSYVAKDVVGFVDASFRTIPDARSRGVFGFSSGGMGAWNIVSQNPDIFTAMAVLSADTFLDMTHKVFTYKFFDNIWPEPPDGPVEGEDWSAMVYAYSAAYAPNPQNPPYFVDLPVAWPSGEVIREVWDRWLSFDPVVNYADRLDNLRRLSGILLDAGSHDQYGLQWGHRVLSHRLTQAGIAHTFTENAGNHGGRANERLQVALEWLGQVLEHE
jgi:S-formylglutathione hydrolase FrmB